MSYVLRCEDCLDTVEAEAVIEALGNHGVPTQYISVLHEFRAMPFRPNISALFREYLALSGMGNLRSESRRALPTSPRFADKIVLVTPNIEQAERMLCEFDNAYGKIGLRLDLTNTMFMKNGLVPDAPFTLNGTNISECSRYVYLGRAVKMVNDLAPELCGRKGEYLRISRE
uniref:Reverse transcriptase domain-containing protein n=1 Tax=Haemonchus contortus TaxID=6289 RepID=A0A7I5ECK5_HAECO